MIHAQRGTDAILIPSQAITDGATVTANLDTKGADYATIRLNISAEEGTDATAPSISLLHSDDTVVTNFATVVANSTPAASATAQSFTYHVDLKGRKRYLRLSYTAGTGTGSNITMGALSTLTRQKEEPGSTTDMATFAVIV